MSGADPAAEVARAAADARQAEQAAEQARQNRDEAIRAALDAGVTVRDLVTLTGLGAPRLYQIRDRRRQ